MFADGPAAVCAVVNTRPCLTSLHVPFRVCNAAQIRIRHPVTLRRGTWQPFNSSERTAKTTSVGTGGSVAQGDRSKEDIHPYSRLSAWAGRWAGRKDAMLKPAVVRRASRRQVTPEPAEVVEGQIAEICRDLAVEAKRIRQLQDQADELRTAIRQWASQSELSSDPRPANRGGQR